MADKMTVALGPVQETLLIPLLGRAESTLAKRPLLADHKAVEIVGKLDYDFSKWRATKTLVGATIRTRMLDEYVAEFIAENPAGTVVEIGAGLNTRFERLDNGVLRWFDLDLPDTIELRSNFFDDSPRRRMIAASVLDTHWFDQVLETGGPYCFVSEAVLIYLEPDDGQRAVRQLAEAFPDAWLVMDTVPRKMVEEQGKHEVMKTMSQESWFRWACDDPASLESSGLNLMASKSFIDAPEEIVRCLPWPMRMTLRFAPWLLRRKVEGYRLNRFHLNTE
ncbi:MAG: class I SAM-dependent methyltransferase [Planctomycetota bacterium]